MIYALVNCLCLVFLRGDSYEQARPILMQVTEGGSCEGLVDPRLENNYDPQEMLRMVACATACIRHSARGRPKMSQAITFVCMINTLLEIGMFGKKKKKKKNLKSCYVIW